MALSLGEEPRRGVEQRDVARGDERGTEPLGERQVRQPAGVARELPDGADRARPVVVGNAREVGPVVDGDAEGAPRVVAGPSGEPREERELARGERQQLVVERQVEPAAQLVGDRRADEPAGLPAREADELGRRPLGEEDEIGLPFAVGGVVDQDRLAGGERGGGRGDVRRQRKARPSREHVRGSRAEEIRKA